MYGNIYSSKGDINVNCESQDYNTPLYIASSRGYVEIVNLLLLEEEIRVNCVCENGNTPLFKASENGHVKVVKLLLLHPNIDVNSKDNYGKTAFDYAKDDRAITDLLKNSELKQKNFNMESTTNDISQCNGKRRSRIP